MVPNVDATLEYVVYKDGCGHVQTWTAITIPGILDSPTALELAGSPANVLVSGAYNFQKDFGEGGALLQLLLLAFVALRTLGLIDDISLSIAIEELFAGIIKRPVEDIINKQAQVAK